MGIEEIDAKLERLEKKLESLETEVRLRIGQYDDSIELLMQMYNKLKGVINKLPEAITDNQSTCNKLVHKTRKLSEQQRDIANSFNKITSRFEQNVIDAIEAQREMIHKIASENMDNSFDEAIKALIIETQKNEINKAIEKALRDIGGGSAGKSKKQAGNGVKLILAGAGSFFLVIGLIFLAIRFL